MIFCPNCGNMLLVEADQMEGRNRFSCPACPYIYKIRETYSFHQPLKKKQVDDVLGGEEAWKNVDATDTICPQCQHTRAYFMQVQTRSADEPSTIFYKCCSCKHLWREQ
eukprot:NODE_141_length_15967_cov_0.946118.p11 type:complete len:109 gc:universal NODE_141_length_15967_cov_0.946118:11769-11443(-)